MSDSSDNNEKIRDQLSAYLDGELSEADAARVEQAVEGDEQLAGELAALRATRQLIRELPLQRAPEDFVSQVLEKAQRERLVAISPEPPTPPLQRVRTLAAAAVLLIAVGAGFVVFITLRQRPVAPEREDASSVIASRDEPAPMAAPIADDRFAEVDAIRSTPADKPRVMKRSAKSYGKGGGGGGGGDVGRVLGRIKAYRLPAIERQDVPLARVVTLQSSEDPSRVRKAVFFATDQGAARQAVFDALVSNNIVFNDAQTPADNVMRQQLLGLSTFEVREVNGDVEIVARGSASQLQRAETQMRLDSRLQVLRVNGIVADAIPLGILNRLRGVTAKKDSLKDADEAKPPLSFWRTLDKIAPAEKTPPSATKPSSGPDKATSRPTRKPLPTTDAEEKQLAEQALPLQQLREQQGKSPPASQAASQATSQPAKQERLALLLIRLNRLTPVKSLVLDKSIAGGAAKAKPATQPASSQPASSQPTTNADETSQAEEKTD